LSTADELPAPWKWGHDDGICIFMEIYGFIATPAKKENLIIKLFGGFNPSKKYWSNWIISPGNGKIKKCLKPPPR